MTHFNITVKLQNYPLQRKYISINFVEDQCGSINYASKYQPTNETF